MVYRLFGAVKFASNFGAPVRYSSRGVCGRGGASGWGRRLRLRAMQRILCIELYQRSTVARPATSAEVRRILRLRPCRRPQCTLVAGSWGLTGWLAGWRLVVEGGFGMSLGDSWGGELYECIPFIRTAGRSSQKSPLSGKAGFQLWATSLHINPKYIVSSNRGIIRIPLQPHPPPSPERKKNTKEYKQ